MHKKELIEKGKIVMRRGKKSNEAIYRKLKYKYKIPIIFFLLLLCSYIAKTKRGIFFTVLTQ